MDSRLGSRCETFLADRGLDNDKVRKRLHQQDILALIEMRNLWEEDNLDSNQLKVPTRPLNDYVRRT